MLRMFLVCYPIVFVNACTNGKTQHAMYVQLVMNKLDVIVVQSVMEDIQIAIHFAQHSRIATIMQLL